MKKMKNLLALLLAVVTVISGIYFVQADGSEAKAETATNTKSATIVSDMLNVKVQPGKTADGSVKALRFVSSVNSLDYKEAGFEVSYEYTENSEPKVATIQHSVNTVYERIASVVEANKGNINMEYQFSPKIVDTVSEYFLTAKLNVTDDTSKWYTVRAYVIPVGGTDADKVYGPSRCVSYDSCHATSYTTMSFVSSSEPTTDSIAVTYGTSNTEATATIIGKEEHANADGTYNVHVTVPVNPTTLPSATKFTFGTYGSTVFRNLYTEYKGTAATKDTSWYNVYDEASTTEYVIATSADLYGFQTLVTTNGKVFTGKTIYVVSDIAVNPTTEGVTANAWAEAGSTPSGVYTWAPIGSWGNQFAGTFDGQMHEISGLYLNATGTRQGFFAIIGAQGKVKNLYIKESLFRSTVASGDAELGSIVGRCYGKIDTIFSDAIVVAARTRVGGMIGWLAGSTANVKNCWYDGEIRHNGSGTVGQTGGIVGYVGDAQNTYDVSDCLFTGKIKFTGYSSKWALRIGGIVGGTMDGKTVTLNLENCVSAGEITQTGSNTGVYGVSTIFGGFDEPKVTLLNLVNVYGTEECFAGKRVFHQYHANTSATGTDPTITGKGSIVSATDLQGVNGYQKTLLDFEETWVARTGKVPALKAFDKEVESAVDLSNYKQDQWYRANETVFGIGSADALHGFSSISQSNNFKGKKVILTDDIDLNPGWIAPADKDTAISGNPKKFTPITKTSDTYKFSGTFDGNNHSIRGLYCDETSNKTGLFGEVHASGIVQNVSILNSYFKTTGAWMGSVVGITQGGTIQNVYSDATIVTTGAQSGGIVGRAEGTVENCWFNGKIYYTKGNATRIRMGGIIGASYAGNSGTTAAGTATRPLHVTNCLNTGMIWYKLSAANTSTVAGVGGIIGSDVNGNAKLIMNDCVSVGTIDCNVFTGTGTIIGALDNNKSGLYSEAKLTNCYGAKDCIDGRTDREIIQYTTDNTKDRVTQTSCAVLLKTELQGDTIYDNTNISLDYTSWIARKNGSPIPKVFVDWIVMESETVEKATN